MGYRSPEPNRLAGVHEGGDRLVRGAQPTGVIDAHHADTGHRTREADRAGSGRQDHLAIGRGQVNAAMARQPRLGGRREGCDNGGMPSQRPGEGCRALQRRQTSSPGIRRRRVADRSQSLADWSRTRHNCGSL